MFRALEDAVRKGYYSSTNVQRWTSPFPAYPLNHGKAAVRPNLCLVHLVQCMQLATGMACSCGVLELDRVGTFPAGGLFQTHTSL